MGGHPGTSLADRPVDTEPRFDRNSYCYQVGTIIDFGFGNGSWSGGFSIIRLKVQAGWVSAG